MVRQDLWAHPSLECPCFPVWHRLEGSITTRWHRRRELHGSLVFVSSFREVFAMSGHAAPAAAPQGQPAVKREFGATKNLEIDKVFRAMVKHKGSDLHMQVGRPPIFRIKGSLVPLDMEPINKE